MLINPLQPVSSVLLAVTPTILQVDRECSYWFQTFPICPPAWREQSADGFSWLGLWEVICARKNKWVFFLRGSINVVKLGFFFLNTWDEVACLNVNRCLCDKRKEAWFFWETFGAEEEKESQDGERESERQIQEQFFPLFQSTHTHTHSFSHEWYNPFAEGVFHITGWLLLQRDAF